MYYPLFRSLRARQIVIFGVTHGTVRKEIGDPKGILLLDGYKEWNGCGKNIGISPLRDYLLSRLDTSMFRLDNKAHRLEHSIEALVPWIQYFNPDATITPIMVTAMPYERMDEISKQLASIIADYVATDHLTLGKDLVFSVLQTPITTEKIFPILPSAWMTLLMQRVLHKISVSHPSFYQDRSIRRKSGC